MCVSLITQTRNKIIKTFSDFTGICHNLLLCTHKIFLLHYKPFKKLHKSVSNSRTCHFSFKYSTPKSIRHIHPPSLPFLTYCNKTKTMATTTSQLPSFPPPTLIIFPRFSTHIKTGQNKKERIEFFPRLSISNTQS